MKAKKKTQKQKIEKPASSPAPLKKLTAEELKSLQGGGPGSTFLLHGHNPV